MGLTFQSINDMFNNRNLILICKITNKGGKEHMVVKAAVKIVEETGVVPG